MMVPSSSRNGALLVRNQPPGPSEGGVAFEDVDHGLARFHDPLLLGDPLQGELGVEKVHVGLAQEVFGAVEALGDTVPAQAVDVVLDHTPAHEHEAAVQILEVHRLVGAGEKVAQATVRDVVVPNRLLRPEIPVVLRHHESPWLGHRGPTVHISADHSPR